MDEIKKGMVVELKSGSPYMTVSERRADDSVVCQWFLEGKLQSGIFNKESLSIVEKK